MYKAIEDAQGSSRTNFTLAILFCYNSSEEEAMDCIPTLLVRLESFKEIVRFSEFSES